jgi:hypothetical protein
MLNLRMTDCSAHSCEQEFVSKLYVNPSEEDMQTDALPSVLNSTMTAQLLGAAFLGIEDPKYSAIRNAGIDLLIELAKKANGTALHSALHHSVTHTRRYLPPLTASLAGTTLMKAHADEIHQRLGNAAKLDATLLHKIYVVTSSL